MRFVPVTLIRVTQLMNHGPGSEEIDESWSYLQTWPLDHVFDATEPHEQSVNQSINAPIFFLHFHFAPSCHLVGEPVCTGAVSGGVSRCSAQTSSSRASAQWAGMDNVCLPGNPWLILINTHVLSWCHHHMFTYVGNIWPSTSPFY